jgi:hypothetical protein
MHTTTGQSVVNLWQKIDNMVPVPSIFPLFKSNNGKRGM